MNKSEVKPLPQSDRMKMLIDSAISAEQERQRAMGEHKKALGRPAVIECTRIFWARAIVCAGDPSKIYDAAVVDRVLQSNWIWDALRDKGIPVYDIA